MLYDTIIIGSGPAGLTAAIYASRDNLKTLVLGGAKWGGQLMLTTEVENYPGFENGIMGPDLMSAMKKQAERVGAEIQLKDVTAVDFSKRPFRVTSQTETFEGKSVIVATGADTVWLGLPNEQRLIGRGVSSCAPCDAFFFKGKKVVVVGGGDSAMEEAQVLSKFATEVIIVHRKNTFRASKIMQDRVLALPNIKTVLNSQIVDVIGGEKVEGVVVRDVTTNTDSKLVTDGLFVAIGHKPNTAIFAGQLKLDPHGYIIKEGEVVHGVGKEEVFHEHFPSMTSVPGVFVAGDVHDHHYRQAVTAAAYGCQAALEVSKWLVEVQ